MFRNEDQRWSNSPLEKINLKMSCPGKRAAWKTIRAARQGDITWNIVTLVSLTLAIPRSLLPTHIEILLCQFGEINLLITCQTRGLLTMLAKRITEPPVSLGKKGSCQVPSWLSSQLGLDSLPAGVSLPTYLRHLLLTKNELWNAIFMYKPMQISLEPISERCFYKSVCLTNSFQIDIISGNNHLLFSCQFHNMQRCL